MPNDAPTSVQKSIFDLRHARLSEALTVAGIDALVLNPGPSLTYLTGLHFHLMERPTTVIFTPGHPIAIILPELETAKLIGLPFPVNAFAFNDDPTTWQDVFRQAVTSTHIEEAQVGVEPGRFRVLELRYLEAAIPHTQIVSAEKVISDLRIRKDAQEISAMRKAVEIAQQALNATLPLLRIGMTEKEIAAELIMQLLRAGTHSDMPFTPIVSSGPNSANPHAFPSNRPISSGDLLVIDWGASCDGYISDLTRTFAIGNVDPELEKIYDIVKQANAAGRAAGRPGIPAGDVDRAARAVIDSSGYGKFFTHRTGHGIGMEGHEEPYMHTGNPLILAPGMAYTVEPGIYIQNYNGVRIEDDVVVTTNGSESLSNFPREFRSIG
jgi:Xaa-Pro dipeptidase